MTALPGRRGAATAMRGPYATRPVATAAAPRPGRIPIVVPAPNASNAVGEVSALTTFRDSMAAGTLTAGEAGPWASPHVRDSVRLDDLDAEL
jgi:hypothetical protein